MEKRRYRKRMYRLFFILVIVQGLILTFLLLRHYDMMPGSGSSDSGVDDNGTDSVDVSDPTSGEILKDQATIFYAGYSISEVDKNNTMLPIDTLKFSFRIEPTLNPGIFGIDLTQLQGNIDWTKPLEGANNETIDFVIVKATQGAKYIDAQFKNNWSGANSAGKKVGAYHCYVYKDKPLDQAKNYLDNVSFESGSIRPIIDLEMNCESCNDLGVSKESMIEDVRAFLVEVEKKSHSKPIIYSNSSFYNTYLKEAFSEYDVWIAQYKMPKPELFPVLSDDLEGSNPAYVMWQFTDRQNIIGWDQRVRASMIPTRYIEKVLID